MSHTAEPTDHQIATWFRPALAPAERDALRVLLGRVDAALHGLGLEYTLYGGALLGLCAYRDLLPWDDDADLLVLTPVHPRALLNGLSDALPDLRVVPHAGLVKVSGAPDRRPWGFPFVDVGFMHPRDGAWYHDSVWGGVDAFPAAEVVPVRRERFGSIEVSAPNDPAAVCRRKYGPECLTSAVPPAFDHRTERPTGFPSVRVPLERIDRVLKAPPEPPGPSASPAPEVRRCVALVPSGKEVSPAFEAALTELNRRGLAVRRVREDVAPPGFRDRMAADALAAGFDELLLLDPAIAFDPEDVDRLRAHGLPFVCGVYPASGRQGLVCKFAPGTTTVRLGTGGGPLPVVSCGLGFALVRRSVFEGIAAAATSDTGPKYFAAPGAPTPDVEDAAFCARATAAGVLPTADTSIRLWRTGLARLGWEDAGGDRVRTADFTLRVLAPGDPTSPDPKPESTRESLREPARPLPPGFPRIGLYLFSYAANAASLEATLASVRASDWGAEPAVLMQPADWPTDRESGSRNFKRALDAALADGCDFALILEDDVRVGRRLRHNLLANPLVRRDQCDYLSLFVPDLLADPWERSAPHLGYRLARPRYAGPNALWERRRVWGSQGYLLSARLVRAARDRWDRLREGQDSRVLSVCNELQVPLWYTAPCLVDHAPVKSAFGTPDAYAPDFDPEYRLEVGAGFQPPEAVPGWLTLPEAELLWRTAADRTVLELGTARGRSTVCLGQAARHVTTVDIADQSEAAEWAYRFGLADRVAFRRGDAGAVCRELSGPFDLIFIDTQHDAASVERDIAATLPLLAPDGLMAFHDYPDPGWPAVRRVVDAHARTRGWKRVAQADFLGVFHT